MTFYMKLKTGIDVIEVKRIEKSIEKYKEKFLDRIFTQREIEYCEGKNAQKFQSYAGRFAVKEAVFKALSECIDNKFDVEWKDIEVINDGNGRPCVNLYGNFDREACDVENIDVSISHIGEIAVASTVVQLGR